MTATEARACLGGNGGSMDPTFHSQVSSFPATFS
jgi:hypothetical protein